MNTFKWTYSIVCLVVLSTGCASAPNASRAKNEDIETITLPVRTPFWLNDQELTRFKRLALIGDLPASYCIANHYAYAAKTNDPDRSFWILIAAENGDTGAMTMISDIYRAGSDLRFRERAEFWRLRAESTRSPERIDCHAAAH